MLKFEKNKALALILAGLLTFSLASCDKKTDEESATTTETVATTEEPIYIEDISVLSKVNEGDVYAINKFTVKGEPGGYNAISFTEEEQGIAYANGTSQITVRALNYKSNITDIGGDLSHFTDMLRNTFRDMNILLKCDTEYLESFDSKVDGFDAINYDILVTQNDFENEKKIFLYNINSRLTVFFSEHDIYYIMFSVKDDKDVDAEIANYEEFLDSIVIDEDAVNIEN